MISNDRKCKCLSPETGTLVFAIINIFVVTISCLLSTIGVIYWSIALFTPSQEFEDNVKYAGYGLPTFIGLGIGVVLTLQSSLVALIFAVFLLHGIVKKNAEHVKAYFVYGVVVIMLCLAAVLIYLAILISIIVKWRSYVPSIGDHLVPVVIVIVICFIYSLILAMVRTVYRKMRCQDLQYRHQLLENPGTEKM